VTVAAGSKLGPYEILGAFDGSRPAEALREGGARGLASALYVIDGLK
jgi:hypothetical protein